MEDRQIIDLYWERSENAISETDAKYGKYCHTIAFNILHNTEDSEECVNDTYLKAWNTIPTLRPERFSAFLAKITRNLSLHKYEHNTATKRTLSETAVALDELADCVPADERTEDVVDEMVLTEILNRFLTELSVENRKIFMRRYWYLSSIKEIAADFGMTESKIKMVLLRSRNALKKVLEKEGITL